MNDVDGDNTKRDFADINGLIPDTNPAQYRTGEGYYGTATVGGRNYVEVQVSWN